MFAYAHMFIYIYIVFIYIPSFIYNTRTYMNVKKYFFPDFESSTYMYIYIYMLHTYI